jgi:hypothetical protein
MKATNMQQHRIISVVSELFLNKQLYYFCCILLSSRRMKKYFKEQLTLSSGTRWRKVAVSIPGAVIGIFHSLNISGRTMALGSTQPLTEMSTRNISWGVKAVGTWG